MKNTGKRYNEEFKADIHIFHKEIVGWALAPHMQQNYAQKPYEMQ